MRATKVRNLFRAYDKSPSSSYMRGAEFVSIPKLLTSELVARKLKIKEGEAKRLMECFKAIGLLEAESNVPTAMAGQLKEASAMMKINRRTADRMVAEVLKVAKEENVSVRKNARIETIEVFGSCITTAPKVSDIDLLVRFPPISCEEDLDEQDRIAGKLRVSRYVSTHSELDAVALTSERKRISRE
jgi:predicted nucleotidyltransferase